MFWTNHLRHCSSNAWYHWSLLFRNVRMLPGTVWQVILGGFKLFSASRRTTIFGAKQHGITVMLTIKIANKFIFKTDVEKSSILTWKFCINLKYNGKCFRKTYIYCFLYCVPLEQRLTLAIFVERYVFFWLSGQTIFYSPFITIYW